MTFKIIILFLAYVFFVRQLYGFFNVGRSGDDFFKDLGKTQLAVSFFYFNVDEQLREAKKQMRKSKGENKQEAKKLYYSLKQQDDELDELVEQFKTASQTDRYKDAEVNFVVVDGSNDKNKSLVSSLGIKTNPTYDFFKYGSPVGGERIEKQLLPFELRGAIENVFVNEIKEDQNRKHEEKLARESAPVVVSPFYSRWDSLYGPSWSGRYWRGRRYRRGPYFGIGFGIGG
ncbi:hypothetical protein HN446_05095 [bacterium]|jgi:hypothetical protein|nr:hypothetical protein [bacterium]